MTFKKINPKETIYHYIEINGLTITLFDSEFDIPICFGSKNLISAKIGTLNPNITIFYYKMKNGFIKLNKTYKNGKFTI